VRAFASNGGFSDIRHPAMRWYGACAVVAGAAGGVAIAAPGSARLFALLAGTMSVLWAIVRAVIFRFADADLTAEDPALARGALALGLLAYALALTPEARLAAWALSAGISSYALERAGQPRRIVWQAIALAWGAQAIVVIGEWVARSAFVAVLAARG